MDPIMFFGGVIFSILFLFLLFIFIVIALSCFTQRHRFSDHTPPISIIIPAYNEEKNIAHCLRGIHTCDYPSHKLEVIVVDDGSTDSTADIALSHGAKVIRGSHEGKPAALTLGAKKASHEIICTIDADTFVDTHCIRRLAAPFIEKDIGATTGTSTVHNSNGILGAFQALEYQYNNLIRHSFSTVFGSGIWFFGALACYRKSALEKIGYFKTDTLAEDMDSSLELKRAGFRTINVFDAKGATIAPSSLIELYSQRKRWWIGTLQALSKNKSLFSLSSPASINFLFINQWWWSVYAFISLPLIAYQVFYWLPYNLDTPYMTASYLVRWFTLLGPFYVLYKIPDWGISFYSICGVLSGILSCLMILWSYRLFHARIGIRPAFVIFLYFPYTILLNSLIALSILHHALKPHKYFIK